MNLYRHVASGGFRFCPPDLFLAPPTVFCWEIKVANICDFAQKAFGFRRRPFFFLEITCFWPEKTLKFVISARKSLRISAKTFFFFNSPDFHWNFASIQFRNDKNLGQVNAGFQLSPPDFNFAPPPRSREAGDAPESLNIVTEYYRADIGIFSRIHEQGNKLRRENAVCDDVLRFSLV